MGLEIDLARFPIVVCRLQSSADSAANLAAACDAYVQELTRHRGIFVCVHDWSVAHDLPPELWRAAFEHAVLPAPLHGRCVGQAIVVSSPSLRAFTSGRALSEQLPYPVRVASTLEAALSWCTWQLRRSEPQAV